jgi:hypothetical protein
MREVSTGGSGGNKNQGAGSHELTEKTSEPTKPKKEMERAKGFEA